MTPNIFLWFGLNVFLSAYGAKYDVCTLPAESGMCLAYFPMYFFNSSSCKCDEFIYGGCGGNANRFETLEACKNNCPGCSVTPTLIPRSCTEAPETGPCRAAFPRFFYNTTSCKCETFTWGGCDGNGNNYETIDACLQQCDGHSKCGTSEPPNCYLPSDPGPCDAVIERHYYDVKECKCRKFNYGGCKGNSNNFASNKLCTRACGNATCPVCNLPADTGPCKAAFPRYFYNAQTCRCEQFTYGGCAGNGNRYETIEECNAECGSVTCPICNLPPSRGPCKARLERWYFDTTSCKCKTFTYGRCHGNLNRFLTKKDCEGSCGSYPCPVCSLEMKVGPCRAAISRWYYDSQ